MNAVPTLLAAIDTAPAVAWAESGLMALSGPREGAPVVPAFDAMSRIEMLLEDVARRSARFLSAVRLDTRVLTERASLQRSSRGGQHSCNRACRLIEARDGWVAVNLPRPVDLDAIPALTRCAGGEEPWAAITRAARTLDAAELVARGEMLGVAVAAVPAPGHGRPAAAMRHRLQRYAPAAPASRDYRATPPLVIDLSALWAGPLCGHVLAEAGARVIKVESVARPDSIRASSPELFDLLHGRKQSVALDFRDAAERRRLARLLERADVVITSARARAFEQLDLAPATVMRANPGLTWVAITGHGYLGESRQRVGFGDDAAAAGGLLAWSRDARPCFLGDAFADPLAGLAAAAAALDGLESGGGMLADVSLAGVAAWVAAARPLGLEERGNVAQRDGQWHWHGGDRAVRVAAPRARLNAHRAAAFGEHTASVLRELTHE